MKIRIHRGANEIGGSCVEVEARGSRIVIDIGIPLVDDKGGRFDKKVLLNADVPSLIKKKILPDIEGLYKSGTGNDLVDGVLISHAHIDHYGLYEFLHNEVQVYLGEGAKRLIDISELFLGLKGRLRRHAYIKSGYAFTVGNFRVTPYLVDHSAFDAYAFLIEHDGKKLLYSGDFRTHGRKSNAYKWFLKNVPIGVDALLLEGSVLGRKDSQVLTEIEVENMVAETAGKENGMVFGILASQNVDRLVSFFKAALRTRRLFLIDVYTANILDSLKDICPNLPYPSDKFANIKVYFPTALCNRLRKFDRTDLITKFRLFRMTKKEIGERAGEVLMIARPSMIDDLSRIRGINSATVIYSMWEGYLTDGSMCRFIKFMEANEMRLLKIHSSGHASAEALKGTVDILKPKAVIPIHTFHPENYKDLFPSTRILDAVDSQELVI